MFEIIDEVNKQIFVQLHIEEIYSIIAENFNIEKRTALFSYNEFSIQGLKSLKTMDVHEQKYKDYELIVDFSFIKSIYGNQKSEFYNWMNKGNLVKICNTNSYDSPHELESFNETDINYLDAFKSYAKKYILKNCHETKGYITQIGTELGVYINLKRIIENSSEMFRWCYIIAYNLNRSLYFKRRNTEKKLLFFCHTLNGTNIAGVLSLLVDCDMIYVDHLGPYNKLNKINFYKDMYEPKEFVIVSDMICQGNELLRAKNIVEYLGGTVKGCAGILKLDISNFNFSDGVEAFAINYSAEEARNELKYTIKTKLCNGICDVGKGD